MEIRGTSAIGASCGGIGAAARVLDADCFGLGGSLPECGTKNVAAPASIIDDQRRRRRWWRWCFGLRLLERFRNFIRL
jgi:hypothetical protein